MSHLREAEEAFFFHYDPESHRICWRLEIRYNKFPSKLVPALAFHLVLERDNKL